VLIALLLIVLAGCATPTLQHSHTPSLPVPFIAQKPNYCGPAALAMLANYYGHAVSQDDIAASIYLPEIRGTLTADLAEYARRFGLWVRQYRGTPTDLRQKLSAGVPVIVLGNFGAQHHFFVVLGIDDFAHTVTVHSDQRPNLVLPLDQFTRAWDRADRWTLLVCPPDRATWRLSADEHNDRGVFLERTGQLTAAAANYLAATELQPANSYFQMNLGNALLKQQLFREAASAYARAVQLAPDNADALNNLAYAYGELNANLAEAAQLCRRAAELRPSHRAYYLDTLGSLLFKQGKPVEAIAAYEQALAATTERQTALRAGIQQRLAAARGQPAPTP
jgi:tetratricopeptide (TPR) repeat protein